jgi:multidrug efflux pump subunit AcrA (membrane-fusion protein)
MADLRRKSLKQRILARRVTVIVVTVVVVGGGAAVAWAATRPADTSYRVATAAPASVTESLASIGTIQPVSQATVAFPMSGQVASVGVTVGQQVTVGETLAQLNTTSLAGTVSSDQSSVATAQAKLASDQTSQTSVSSAVQTTTPSSVESPRSATTSGTSSKLTGLLKGLSTDQNAVRQAQQQVDADLTLVSAADKQLAATCPAVVASLGSLANQTKSDTKSDNKSSTKAADDTTTPAPTSTTTPTLPDPTQVTDCTTLIDQASTDETRTDNDEHALSTSVSALSTALDQVVTAVGQSAQSSTTTSGGSTSRSATTHATGSTGGGISRTNTPAPASADQIAADQAMVDADNAQLAAAQQNMSAATLLSPIAGTVAEVTIVAGANASANSTTAHIMVIGPGEDEVTTAVNDTEVGKVKPGQVAAVTPDGATKPIAGKVTSIGALGSTTSSGSASYPVTISLSPTSQQLFDGATASVSVTLGTAQAAVSVPTSAVQTFGAFSLVTKMVDGKPTTTRVTIGVAGSTVTQITSGLKVGDQVMLADISEPMPTSGTGSTRGLTGRTGFGGGGGGFTGGGFTGGAAGGGGRAATGGGG